MTQKQTTDMLAAGQAVRKALHTLPGRGAETTVITHGKLALCYYAAAARQADTIDIVDLRLRENGDADDLIESVAIPAGLPAQAQSTDEAARKWCELTGANITGHQLAVLVADALAVAVAKRKQETEKQYKAFCSRVAAWSVPR